MRLDAKTVAALTLSDTDVIRFDGELRGFGLRLRRDAVGAVRKAWIVQYRRGGSTRRMTLGAAEVLSAEQARATAKKLLARVALGDDPQADKAERRSKDRLSLKAVVEEYLAAKQGEVRPRTFVEIRRHLTGPYFRDLHGIPLDAVSRRDVAAAVLACQRNHGRQAAILGRQTLSALFGWAMRMGLVEHNPVVGAAQPKPGEARSRVLTDAELIAIWKACQDDDYGKIVRLLILTGCRRTEVGGMRWSEIADDAWTLPAERSKNGRAHTLPLASTAREIIASVPHMATRDHLFGERAEIGFTNWRRRKDELDERSEVSDWIVHDIRRSVATKLADIGVMPHIIEQILNHQSGHKRGHAGTYNRSVYEREVRAALALWEDHIRQLIKGGERKVLPFSAS